MIVCIFLYIMSDYQEAGRQLEIFVPMVFHKWDWIWTRRQVILLDELKPNLIICSYVPELFICLVYLLKLKPNFQFVFCFQVSLSESRIWFILTILNGFDSWKLRSKSAYIYNEPAGLKIGKFFFLFEYLTIQSRYLSIYDQRYEWFAQPSGVSGEVTLWEIW